MSHVLSSRCNTLVCSAQCAALSTGMYLRLTSNNYFALVSILRKGVGVELITYKTCKSVLDVSHPSVEEPNTPGINKFQDRRTKILMSSKEIHYW
jgi:hypothetical protein